MSTSNGLLLLPVVSFILVVNNLNPIIKEFFLNSFVLFVIFTLLFYRMSRNIVLSMAESFITVIAINLVTIQDPVKSVKEAFQLIYPTTDSKLECNDMTVEELIEKAGGEEELKEMMYNKDVPRNIEINGKNAPLIATYLQLC